MVRLCGGFFLSSLRTERGRSKDCFKICMYYVVSSVFFFKKKHLGMRACIAAYFLFQNFESYGNAAKLIKPIKYIINCWSPLCLQIRRQQQVGLRAGGK